MAIYVWSRTGGGRGGGAFPRPRRVAIRASTLARHEILGFRFEESPQKIRVWGTHPRPCRLSRPGSRAVFANSTSCVLRAARPRREKDEGEAGQEHGRCRREGNGGGGDEAGEIGAGALVGVEEAGDEVEAAGGAGERSTQGAVGVDGEAVVEGADVTLDPGARDRIVEDVKLGGRAGVLGDGEVVVGAGEDQILTVGEARADGEPLQLLRHAAAE